MTSLLNGCMVDRLLSVDPHGLKPLLGCIVRVEATVCRLRSENPFTISKKQGRQFMWLLKPAHIAHAHVDHVWVQGCKRNRSWALGSTVKFTAKLSYYTDERTGEAKFVVRSPFRPL